MEKLDKSNPKCKITQPICDAIVEATSKGLTRRFAAQCAGISVDALYMWLANGREHLSEGIDTPYARLVLAVQKAEAENATRLLALIEKAAINDESQWKAAAWIMERRYKDDYGRAIEVHQHLVAKIDTADAKECDDRIKELIKK